MRPARVAAHGSFSALTAAILTAMPALASGCGYGLLQTAKPTPVGDVGVTLGATYVMNEIDDAGGRGGLANTGAEAGLRVGVAERIDLGIAGWLGPGFRLDGKYSLFDPREPYAVAPRLGAGFAATRDGEAVLAFAGVVGSYELGRVFEPYAGLTFANHWISRKAPEGVVLDPDQEFAKKAGYGDGLVQLSVGVHLVRQSWFGIYVEYSRWIPAQNDPGDFYKFIPTNLFTLGLRFGGGPREDGVSAKR